MKESLFILLLFVIAIRSSSYYHDHDFESKSLESDFQERKMKLIFQLENEDLFDVECHDKKKPKLNYDFTFQCPLNFKTIEQLRIFPNSENRLFVREPPIFDTLSTYPTIIIYQTRIFFLPPSSAKSKKYPKKYFKSWTTSNFFFSVKIIS